ncbi:unnamed protein product [Schistocephalus solidus]|uniref:DUF3480 domain-containing protein n=1 Tax=Schistocephalus solidus TaxID=70667 RepID=A0A183SIY5_SCHSO|nr:unnamed protein product [Schistocephalus solidus]
MIGSHGGRRTACAEVPLCPMPLGLASTLPLGNGRVLCSFKLNGTVRALVKLYEDVAEFNFLIEYLKLIQSVTNARVRPSSQKYETIICTPLHALSWSLVENQGDGVGRLCEIFYRLTADMFRQFKLDKNGAGPRLFIPFTFHSTCVPPTNCPLENQGLIIAYTASHHLSHNNALNSNIFRTVVREVSNHRSISVPSRIPTNSDSSLSENHSLLSDLSEFSTGPSGRWLSREALCEQQPTKSWHSSPSLVCNEEYPESNIRKTYTIDGPPPYETHTLNFFEDDAFCYHPRGFMVCNISSPEGLDEAMIAQDCLLIYESLHLLTVTETNVVSSCQIKVIRTRGPPSQFSDIRQNESHNSMYRPPGHRGSLNILEQRLCLNDLMQIATRIKLHNGESGGEVPLPSASMRFVIRPLEVEKASGRNSDVKDQNQNTAEVAHHEGPLVMTSRLTAGDANGMELSVELDVGLFLRKWLNKLGDIEMESLEVAKSKRSSLRRSIREHITESSKRHEGTVEVPDVPLRRRSSRVSLNLARGLHQDDEDFRHARDTLSGNQTRRASECLRPWTSMQGEEAVMLPGDYSNDNTLLSNLLHRISDGTTEVLVQSVDLISSGSTLSIPLSVNAPRLSGGQNTSNECSRHVGAEGFRMTASCQPSYLHPFLRPEDTGKGHFASVSEGGDLKHHQQIYREDEVVVVGSPARCQSFDIDGPTQADPLSVSDKEEELEVPVRSWTPMTLNEPIIVTLQVDVEVADSLELPYEVCNLEASLCEKDFVLPVTNSVRLSWSPPPVLTNSEADLPKLAPRQSETRVSASAAPVSPQKARSVGPDTRQSRSVERQDTRRRGPWVHSKSRTRKPEEADKENEKARKKSQKPRSRKSNFVALISRFFLGSDLCVSKPRRPAPEESLTTDSMCAMEASSEMLQDGCRDGRWPPTPALQQTPEPSFLSRNEEKGVGEESESNQNTQISESLTEETSGKEPSINDVGLHETSGFSLQAKGRRSSLQTSEASDTSTVVEEGTYGESLSDYSKSGPARPNVGPTDVRPVWTEGQRSDVFTRSHTQSVRGANLKCTKRELEAGSSSDSNSTHFASLRQPRKLRRRTDGRGRRSEERRAEAAAESSISSDESLIGDANFMSREIYKLKSASEIINALEEELAHTYTSDIKSNNYSKVTERKRASTSSRQYSVHTKQSSRPVSKHSQPLEDYTSLSIPMLHAPAVVSEADLIRSSCPACRRTPESSLARNCQTNGSAYVAGIPPVPKLLSSASRGPGFRPLHPGSHPPVGYFQPMYTGQNGQSAYISPDPSWSCWGNWNVSRAHDN